MYNLHCHSLLSDGALIPSEVAVRYQDAGYKVIAITDHADYSNIKTLVPAIMEFTHHWPKNAAIKVLPGIELTHLPPEHFKPLAKFCRSKGIKIIVGHGETPVEPVVEGTNRAALEADIDILAHPGLISDADILLAKKKGIFLEVTARQGHSEGNAHVIQRGLALGANLILNTDSHNPEDIISPSQVIKIISQAGLTENDIQTIYSNVEDFLKKKGAL
ncbi:MAG: histidinol phosphate phosphatase domain-containing protein [Candidatus Omnitrophica bacterium]|nr:histidinol phosphate phosphatase domain-containing protein [Candidatus Omnitrophota bacterium]